jgi:hypothetical protein
MEYGAGRKDAIGKAPPLAAGDRQKHHPKQSRQGARSIRSLVVDDDSTILKCVTFMLSLLGFEKVDTAQKEIEAMSKLAAGRPYEWRIQQRCAKSAIGNLYGNFITTVI